MIHCREGRERGKKDYSKLMDLRPSGFPGICLLSRSYNIMGLLVCFVIDGMDS
jgi:hypothetical protein